MNKTPNKNTNKTSRRFCFTLNNPTDEDLAWLRAALSNEQLVRYAIFGHEVGDSGTPHLQGYAELVKPIRCTGFKKATSKKAHVEVAYGNRLQARDYCKKDGKFEEFGNWESGGQGTRNDIKDVMDAIKTGIEPLKVCEDFPETVARYHNFFDKYTALVQKEATKGIRKVETFVFIGDAGSGKTRAVYEYDPNVFMVNSGETFPFDGYNDEKTICLDDFYGGIKYHELLRILDIYRLKVNVKGSHRYANWNRVYITSNEPPEEWYSVGLTPALERRLTYIKHFTLQ